MNGDPYYAGALPPASGTFTLAGGGSVEWTGNVTISPCEYALPAGATFAAGGVLPAGVTFAALQTGTYTFNVTTSGWHLCPGPACNCGGSPDPDGWIPEVNWSRGAPANP